MGFDDIRGIFSRGDKDNYDDEYDEFDDYEDFDDDDEPDDDEKPVKRGFMSRFASKPKKEEFDDEEDYDDDDEFEEPVKPVEKKPAKTNDFFGRKNTESKVINMSKTSSYGGNASGQIYMLKPKKIDDAKSAVDALLSNKIVILNLEGIALDLAQSVTDFISGASYCISGNFSTISQNVFVYTPRGVDLTGAFDEDELLGSSLRDF